MRLPKAGRRRQPKEDKNEQGVTNRETADEDDAPSANDGRRPKCPSGDFGSRVNRLAGIAVEGGNLL